MKILVIGSGGREHALVWKIAQSRRVKKIFCAPGNAGISGLATCLDIKADDIDGLLAFAKKESIDLTVVGPEAPLAAGIVDIFGKEGLKIFGPCEKAAQLEASKSFSKGLMKKYKVPTADFVVCLSVDEVMRATKRLGLPVVLKADGLAAGKGVIICSTADDVKKAAEGMLIEKIFGESGKTVVVEEFLEGQEASILVLTNGRYAIPLASSQDHKRIFDGDQGPNTGGMGAYSPASVVTKKILAQVMKRVIRPVVSGMAKEGMSYRGILYAGIMMTKKGIKVLEFNVRFGDPETQAVLARLDSDLVSAMLWTLGKPRPRLRREASKPIPLKWNKKAAVCVVLASGGYPDSYQTGKEILGLEKISKIKDAIVFHAGTKWQVANGRRQIVTSGGRVLGVTGLGKTIAEAIDKAYEAVGEIAFEGIHYRRDIGWRAIEKK